MNIFKKLINKWNNRTEEIIVSPGPDAETEVTQQQFDQQVLQDKLNKSSKKV